MLGEDNCMDSVHTTATWSAPPPCSTVKKIKENGAAWGVQLVGGDCLILKIKYQKKTTEIIIMIITNISTLFQRYYQYIVKHNGALP